MPPPPDPLMRSRRRTFASLTIVCVLAAVGFVTWAAIRHPGSGTQGPRASARQAGEPASGVGPRIVFQHVARGEDYAHVAVTGTAGGTSRRITGLVCERIHMTEGRGLCLMSRTGLTGAGFTAMVVDEQLHIVRKVKLHGILTRARVSPDGRYGAATGFVVGHSYADAGEFLTQTTLIDMETGAQLADLEDFAVTRDGRPVEAVDRNFWGVTFAADGDTFYATMRTRGRTWLIEGTVSSRRARTLRENVECPSLSPDGTRIAYKRRVDDGSVIWRLHVLDLRTMQDAPLTEARMVDDQAEWLDDDTILYGLEGDVWAVQADGAGAPRRLLPDALSPAVIHAAAS
jgi:hypothetical protein